MAHQKKPHEQEAMREGGQILARILKDLVAKTKPGLKRSDINSLAGRYCLKYGVKPSFLGYNGYPSAVCISLNSEVVHGLPGDDVIKKGDIVSLDMGVQYKGYHTDSAVTFVCGVKKSEVPNNISRLIKTTEQSFYSGVSLIKPGVRLGDISSAIQNTAESEGYGVIRMLVGHGIGKKVHEEPHVPNFGEPGTGPILKEGMTLAIEPMLTESGTFEVVLLKDGWTYVTADGSLSSHYEHTVLVTRDGHEILTELK